MKFFEFEEGKVYTGLGASLGLYRLHHGIIEHAPNGGHPCWTKTILGHMDLYHIDFVEVDIHREEFNTIHTGITKKGEEAELCVACNYFDYDMFKEGEDDDIYVTLIDGHCDEEMGISLSFEEFEEINSYVQKLRQLKRGE